MTKNIFSLSGRTALLAVCVMFATVACKKEKEAGPFVSLSQQMLTVEFDGLTVNGDNANFEIRANTNWSIASDKEWVGFNVDSGPRGVKRIFVTAEENTTPGDREAVITVSGPNAEPQTTTLIQRVKTDLLTVSPEEITVVRSGKLANGKQASILISTNSDWTVTPKAEWITPDKTSGTRGDRVILLMMGMNNTGDERTGQIEIEAGTLKRTVTVTQNMNGLALSTEKITATKDGLDANENPPTFVIKALGDWEAASDKEWMRLDKTNGAIGEHTVTLTFEENTEGADRPAVITVTSDGVTQTIEVVQVTTSFLMVDDGQAVGYQYYSENFDFCIPFGKDDQVTNNKTGSTLPIHGTQADRQEAYAAFHAAGLTEANPNGPTANCMYIAAHYLKMGRNNNQTGVILPLLDIAEGKGANVKVSFKVAPALGAWNDTNNPPGLPDNVEFTVEISEGAGVIADTGTKVSSSMTHDLTLDDYNTEDYSGNRWFDKEVVINGASHDTRIMLRSTQYWSVSGGYRWFLDDIKIVKESAL